MTKSRFNKFAGGCLLLLAILATVPTEAASKPEREEERTVSIYKQTVRATVFLSSSYVTGPSKNTTVGTGFILDESGTVVTNAHVVDGAHHMMWPRCMTGSGSLWKWWASTATPMLQSLS